jgi:ElaB/YqjD/DUF883 family membrane-anchored ribosome-binding protein
MKNGKDTRDRLEEDFRRVVRDAEALLRATADQGSDAVAAARARAEQTLREATNRLYQIEGDLVHRTRAAAKATDEMVHDRPWQAIGIAAGVGFLIGVLSGRR